MKTMPRRCLACDETFPSWGSANRLCRHCRRANGIEDIPGTQGVDHNLDLYAFLRRHSRQRTRPSGRRRS
jgi:hypothetical protein